MATKKTNSTSKKNIVLSEDNVKPVLNGAAKKAVPKETGEKPLEKKTRTKKDKLVEEKKIEAISPEVKLKKKSTTKPPKKVEEQPKPESKIKKVSTSKKEGTDTSSKKPREKIVSKRTKNPSNEKGLRITFQLRFTSEFGQTLYITGNHDALGNNEVATALPMQYYNHEFWYATINIPDTQQVTDNIIYRYFIKDIDGNISMEFGNDKQLNPSTIDAEELLMIDSWNYAGYYENTFYTEPFKRVLFKDSFTSGTVKQ
ncbi:MAG TPA: CBM20 domain-containing protein, partial [Segetibacter sp.]